MLSLHDTAMISPYWQFQSNHCDAQKSLILHEVIFYPETIITFFDFWHRALFYNKWIIGRSFPLLHHYMNVVSYQKHIWMPLVPTGFLINFTISMSEYIQSMCLNFQVSLPNEMWFQLPSEVFFTSSKNTIIFSLYYVVYNVISDLYKT